MPPPARRNGCVATTSARICAKDIDKSLATLRESLNARQSASVSSVETKSVVSDRPLPNFTGSAGSGSHHKASRPARVRVGFLPPGKCQKPRFTAHLAPVSWYQQGEEFQRSAVLVNFPRGQNKSTIEKFCASVFPGTDPASYSVKCKEGSDNAPLLFRSKLECQQFVEACTGQGIEYATENLSCSPRNICSSSQTMG